MFVMESNMMGEFSSSFGQDILSKESLPETHSKEHAARALSIPNLYKRKRRELHFKATMKKGRMISILHEVEGGDRWRNFSGSNGSGNRWLNHCEYDH